MTRWITSNPSVEIQKRLPQELKGIELTCPKALASRLKKEYLRLRGEQTRLHQLNRILIQKGKRPIPVPVHQWTDQQATSLTTKLLPLVLGVNVVGLLPNGEVLINIEGSPEWVEIRVSGSPHPAAHLIVQPPPPSSHRLGLLVALTQLLHRPVRAEVHSALLLRQHLLNIYPSGTLLRDVLMQQLFSGSQLQALLLLQMVAKHGRDYRL